MLDALGGEEIAHTQAEEFFRSPDYSSIHISINAARVESCLDNRLDDGFALFLREGGCGSGPFEALHDPGIDCHPGCAFSESCFCKFGGPCLSFGAEF